MNTKTIGALYNKVLSLSCGVEKVKIDLHVHTPASHDFISSPLETSYAYLNILEEAIKNNIKILAITDHNTFSGFRYIQSTLSRDPELKKKYASLKILCGIEITCFSKHLLAIFPDNFGEEQQNIFLHDIGIEHSKEGSEEALADHFGPALLIKKIDENGGFAILAHADSAKGFLQDLCGSKTSQGEMCFNGKSLAKIIQSPALLGIQCNNSSNIPKITELLNNKDYLRKTNPLSFLKGSDCHGVFVDNQYYGKSGQPLGAIYSEVKLSEVSFSSLKMALRDAEMRVCDRLNHSEYPYIEGVAVCSPIFNKDNTYSYFHFSPELNCIIGSRGTGKTTLLEIIQSIIMPNSLRNPSIAFSKYSSAVIFIKNQSTIYAVYSKTIKTTDDYTQKCTYSSVLSFYFKNSPNKNFKKLDDCKEKEFLTFFLAKGYQQRQLFDYSQNPNTILEIVDDFINWKSHENYQSICKQLENRIEKLQELLKDILHKRKETNTSFVDYIDFHGNISEITNLIKIINKNKSELRKLRNNMIEELNRVLIGKVKLSTEPVARNITNQNYSLLAENVRIAQSKPYEYFLQTRKLLFKIYALSPIEDVFNLYSLLLNKEYSTIINTYKIQQCDESILPAIRNELSEDDILTFIDDTLKMEYNINSGTRYNENFKFNHQISMGQNAVALLLLILNASYSMGDARPLLMDQPEDDLDNSYIYSTLVKEFRKSKEKRQVIISTHNPNIPVSADAENIMVLEFNGEHGFLANVGSIDSQETASKVLEIMEGGKEAIHRRMSKYNK